jgi:hypothetical protein
LLEETDNRQYFFTKIWSFMRRLMFLWFERTSMALLSAECCRARVVVRGKWKN